jgi:hypothetical protein
MSAHWRNCDVHAIVSGARLPASMRGPSVLEATQRGPVSVLHSILLRVSPAVLYSREIATSFVQETLLR